MVVPGESIMSKVGFDKEICQFYEKQLADVRILAL